MPSTVQMEMENSFLFAFFKCGAEDTDPLLDFDRESNNEVIFLQKASYSPSTFGKEISSLLPDPAGMETEAFGASATFPEFLRIGLGCTGSEEDFTGAAMDFPRTDWDDFAAGAVSGVWNCNLETLGASLMGRGTSASSLTIGFAASASGTFGSSVNLPAGLTR